MERHKVAEHCHTTCYNFKRGVIYFVLVIDSHILSYATCSDGRRFAVFCTVSSGTQILDTEVQVVDRNCADLAFSEVFAFSNMKPEFNIKLEVYIHKFRGERRNWFQRIKEDIFLTQKKAKNFKILSTQPLSVDNCSGQ